MGPGGGDPPLRATVSLLGFLPNGRLRHPIWLEVKPEEAPSGGATAGDRSRRYGIQERHYTPHCLIEEREVEGLLKDCHGAVLGCDLVDRVAAVGVVVPVMTMMGMLG